ncbi:hypothetical protein BGZ58_004891 [Dissophora ornata]|nr:hypothetical protein BGZ58_004891 [Dissophora ornata]
MVLYAEAVSEEGEGGIGEVSLSNIGGKMAESGPGDTLDVDGDGDMDDEDDGSDGGKKMPKRTDADQQ